VRRIAAWRLVSPLVPFVYGALLDDVSTCAWAIGLERWAWDDELETKTSPIQNGVPGGNTFDVACLPYAIDIMIPPTYRWALARAQVEADLTVTDSKARHLIATDLTAKGLTVKQVKTREAAKQLAASFRELLNAAKGEYPTVALITEYERRPTHIARTLSLKATMRDVTRSSSTGSSSLTSPPSTPRKRSMFTSSSSSRNDGSVSSFDPDD
jgi:hypothetical protein